MTRIPTTSLRFIERSQIVRKEGPYEVTQTIRVLQQMFETTRGKRFWEDVPLVTADTGSEHGK